MFTLIMIPVIFVASYLLCMLMDFVDKKDRGIGPKIIASEFAIIFFIILEQIEKLLGLM